MARQASGKPQPKPPAMQFYVRDWLTSTVGLPLEAKGLHIDFLCIAWDGPLPDDAKWRQRVAGVSAAKAAALWAILRPRWHRTRKGWINPRQERQRRDLAAFKARQSHAAGMRWASVGHASGMPPAYAERMPNRCSSTSSSSSEDQDQDQDQRAAARGNHRLLVALAHTVLDDVDKDRLPVSEIVGEMKDRAGRAKIRYGDFDEVHKALRSAEVQRARRRA
jgi:uncharacterized protein YdaU (DUF1376 family)